jgi:hypothetical protein
VTGADHHVDGRVGPPGDLDGLGRVVSGRFQLAARTFDLGQDRQRRAGPGGIADRLQHPERLPRGRLGRAELPTPQLNRGPAKHGHRELLPAPRAGRQLDRVL